MSHLSSLLRSRLPARTLPSIHHRTLSTTPRLLAWKGSSGEDHITNSKDELDVHSAGAKAGKRDRATDDKQSSAASEHDSRQDNKRAKEDHPEAPGPVIGMNDERGGVGFPFLRCRWFQSVWCSFGEGMLIWVWRAVEGTLKKAKGRAVSGGV